MKPIAACLATTLAICPAGLLAETGLYGKLSAGVNVQSDESFIGDVGSRFAGRATFEPSFAGGGALGYRFGSFALEGEVMYRTAELDSFDTATVTGAFNDGDFSSVAFAANGLFHFPLSSLDAYAGLGLAVLQEVDIDFEQGGIENSLSGDEFGWQVLFGIDWGVTDRWGLTAELRHLEVSEIEFELEDAVLSEAIAGDYSNTGLNIGLRYRF